MSQSRDPLRACPTCGSDDRQQTDRQSVPGGTDWRHYECRDCGFEWRA